MGREGDGKVSRYVVTGRTVERAHAKDAAKFDDDVGRLDLVVSSIHRDLLDLGIPESFSHVDTIGRAQGAAQRAARASRPAASATSPKREGITLTVLADRAGVSQAAFWTAMSCKSGPSIDFVAKVAAALDVDPDELVKRYRKPRSSAK